MLIRIRGRKNVQAKGFELFMGTAAAVDRFLPWWTGKGEKFLRGMTELIIL